MSSTYTIPSELVKSLKQYQKENKPIKTRLPPEPSGMLHIGHAKAAFYNYIIATQFGGEMILRMDDTNPTKESTEFEHSIIDDIMNILKITPSKQTYSSDYFDIIIQLGDKLVKDGLAYVDTTNVEKMREERNAGTESQFRSIDPLLMMSEWEKMKAGQLENSCLRLKMDMKSVEKTLRDPVAFRTMLNNSHHRTGDKYKIYPSYDFSCPVVDAIESITHVFRCSEFSDRDKQYVRILDMLNLPKPERFYYAKLKFDNVELGKRVIKELVNAGKVDGWDDPRLYTLRGLVRRGLHLDGMTEFIRNICFSKNSVNINPTLMWSINRKVIDKIAPRYVVLNTDVKEIDITVLETDKIPHAYESQIQKFHRAPDLGTKTVYHRNKILIENADFSQLVDNEEITLMTWGNMVFSNGTFIRKLDGDFKLTKKKLLWLPVDTNIPNITIVIKTFNNYDTHITNYIGEPALKEIKVGDIIQLLRMKYYICDSKSDNTIVLIEIPE